MELLVHISAPSARRDDDRVKRQAQSYSDFDTVNILPLHSSHAHIVSQNDGLPRLDTPGVGSQDVTFSRWSPSLFLDDTQLARTALESQLITSSLGQEPHLLDLGIDSQSSDDEPEAHIDTLEGSTHDASRVSRGNFLKRLHDGNHVPSPAKRHQGLSSPFVPIQEDDEVGIGYIGPRHSSPTLLPHQASRQGIRIASLGDQKESSSSDDIPSQLPSTYSLSDVASKSSHQDNQLQSSAVSPSTPVRNRTSGKGQSSLLDIGKDSSEQVNQESTQSTALDSRTAVAAVHLPNAANQAAYVTSVDSTVGSSTGNNAQVLDLSRTPVQDLPREILQDHPRLTVTESVIAMPPPPRPAAIQSLHVPVTPGKPGELAMLQTLPLTISASPPTTSLDPFRTHITPSLLALYESVALSHCYQPIHLGRSPRQTERGHWLVDTSRWSVGVQVNFWRFLQQYVESGKSGWGVWCVREISAKQAENERSEAATLGEVKIFCWGEVVQHVYLMLYVASKSKIRKAAARWIDADEKVVVQM